LPHVNLFYLGYLHQPQIGDILFRMANAQADPRLQPTHDYRDKTFLAACQCGFSTELKLSDFQQNETDPFAYVCSCGKSCKVFCNLRQSARKKVSLVGRIARSLDLGKADWFGTVLNISKVGMLMKTEPIKKILENETLSSTILLDDKSKTKLEVRCRVRRVQSSDNYVQLGVEFQHLTALQQQVLEGYLAA
jgi:PilZ domain